MSTKEKIHFVVTGGTMDSFYDPAKDTTTTLKDSMVEKFVKSLQLYTDFEFTKVCMKDSRELDEEDVKNILKTVEESKSKRVIVTHGTYTMPDTARFLKANLKRNDKVVILTGSQIPLTGFAPSDASFNLGFAIAKVQNLDPGVYVCMNARVFAPDEVMKYLKLGKFSSIFGEAPKMKKED